MLCHQQHTIFTMILYQTLDWGMQEREGPLSVTLLKILPARTIIVADDVGSSSILGRLASLKGAIVVGSAIQKFEASQFCEVELRPEDNAGCAANVLALEAGGIPAGCEVGHSAAALHVNASSALSHILFSECAMLGSVIGAWLQSLEGHRHS